MTSLADIVPSRKRQRQLTYLMEIGLIGMLFIGIERGNGGIVINTGVALLVTQLPPLLERDYEIPMDPRLTLWITTAVFLHAFGTVGLPGATATLYSQIWWWDHLTHALSASLVAGVGYATVRAFDEHAQGVHLPQRFIAVFILLFVIAFGVLWEILEFAIALAAEALGTRAVLTQYGLEDTMLDFVFNSIGALIVATWGGAYLSNVTSAIRERFDSRAD
ncbi:hypothetical protein C488_07872 [Natrinema pellirubrum DSM 15624]|uniref:Membrane-spanning protein n=1 Tax=Natrinema pellirubrum (strain DSM 15624 / CIP 106293 / JCM 10476 / NCIMB 786 / 157) TaxID=797303 RepID=L0JKL5_NATP1|nr:hypothetical protein [Natrinema pellirubrum]AGB32085.1 hypothetical protein Natpe_2264 [Natrinema pellirubrum DSM 15624]ELY76905.1 hypothetical protein C488_07872 [Natrinema pellirubrum DSM 15624]